MQLINGAIIRNPMNWVILPLMVIMAVLCVELLYRATTGQWLCGCNGSSKTSN